MDSASKLLNQIAIRDDGCWMFTGAWNKDRYGVMRYNGETKGAHVVSYEIHIGLVPKGLNVCHSCDNPWCVNPEHLYADTQSNNVQLAIDKGRKPILRGEQCGAAKLKQDDVIHIRQLAASGVAHREIGEIFLVGREAIGKIVRRERWRHI